MIAKVLIDLSLDRPFDYRVPESLERTLHPGLRVKVPFGKSTRLGYVTSLAERSDYPDLKELSLAEEHRSDLPEKLLELGGWMADYYCCAKEQALRTLLPGALRHGRIKEKIRVTYSSTEAAEAFLAVSGEKKSCAKRVSALRYLSLHGESTAAELGVSASVLKTLLKAELIREHRSTVQRERQELNIVPTQPLEPTDEQKAALDAIYAMLEKREAGKPRTALLYGVTGSGKTEVYLQAIARAIALGKSSIVLVPEISLTPQTVRRFRARFGDNVSVLHSRLTDAERFEEFMRIRRGEVKIAVGARSALFAPFENLGLIIVDEEHESSYKQSEAPRYCARDVAVMRGQLEDAAVILGSATPSAESYHNAEQGRYLLLRLTHRVENSKLPSIHVVDRRLGAIDKRNSLFSPFLVEAVHERLRRGEQTILFLNRRGYAREMMCPSCTYVAQCPDCAVSYTYSKLRQTLSCHYCGKVIPAPAVCPQCDSPKIRYTGTGTEKIETIAKSLFPDAKIWRMDSDSMRHAEDYETVLDEFRRGRINILIGTQMIAKGLHFPNVTLVGILNADQSLNLPDFRAPERTFQLITQVSGRAGRGEVPGEVIVQTFDPEDETISAAVSGDYERFYRFDMEARKAMGYPPFTHLIAVLFRSEDASKCLAAAEDCRKKLEPYCHSEVRLSDPKPAQIERIKGKYRYLLVVRGTKLRNLRLKMRELVVNRQLPKGVDASIDVDAQSLL